MTMEHPVVESIEGFRLSPQQRAAWLRSRTDGGDTNVVAAVDLAFELDPTKIVVALRALVAEHDILRTIYRTIPGLDVALQVVEPALEPLFGHESLCDVSSSPASEGLVAILKRESARAFDSSRGPLIALHVLGPAAGRTVLVLTMSPLVGDARSAQILLQRLASSGAGPHAVDQPSLQYVQYAEWRHELRGSAEERAAKESLARRIDGASTFVPLAGLPLNASPPGGGVQSYRTSIDPQLVEGLARLCALRSLPPAAVYGAAWWAVLQRLSENQQFAVDVRVLGRQFEELATAVGPYATYVPVRVPPVEGETAAELADSMASVLRQAEEEYLGADDEGGAGLRFGFEVIDWDGDDGGASKVRPLHLQTSGARALSLRVVRLSVGAEVAVDYDPIAFDAPAIATLAARYLLAVRFLVEQRDQPMARMGLATTVERARIQGWNTTLGDAASEDTVTARFEEQARLHPGRLAISAGQTELTFFELNRRANRLAHRLIRAGVRPDDRVGLLAARTAEVFVGMMGILKAGGAYVPVEPDQPRERALAILQEAGTNLVISDGAPAFQPPEGTTLIRLNDPALALEQESDPVETGLQPAHLAYVLFTSGSTGRPKGVMVEHRSAVNLADALNRTVYADQPTELRVSVNAPLSFDGSVKQILQLLSGRTLVVVPQEARRDGVAMLDLLARARVQVLDGTPSHLKLLLAAGLLERTDLALRVALLGGEPIDSLTWRAAANHPSIHFYNVYGPTECTVNTTVASLRAWEAPTIGCPLPGMSIYVLDENREPAPIGLPGEIYIGGAGVARGYLGDPALTNSRFVVDPFAGTPARMYKSGDVGRFRPEGNIEYLGRLDDQVKVRGFRIELGEIEAAFRQHPSVADVAVAVHPDANGDKRLVAYVVARRSVMGESTSGQDYTLPTGHVVEHMNRNETAYLFEEIFDKQTYLKHGIILDRGMTVFDVGANIGMFSLFVSHHCPDARIWAFEPLHPICEKLRANLAKYAPRAQVAGIGLSSEENTATFTFYPRYSMMSSAEAHADAGGEVQVIRTFLEQKQLLGDGEAAELLAHLDEVLHSRFQSQLVECRLRRLSDVIREERVETIELLKIDVQRAELDVLRGLDEEHWPKVRQVVMEVHDGIGKATEGRVRELESLLSERGFVVVVEQDELLKGTDRYNLYAIRRDYRPVDAIAPKPLTSPSAPPAPEELRRFVEAKLPDYMIPHLIRSIDTVPLNRSGKVDRKALPDALSDLGRAKYDGSAATTPLERALCRVWAHSLGVGEVGIDDNFFALGGDSIRSIQVQAQAKKQGIVFSLQDLFVHQTVRELATVARQELTRSPDNRYVPFSLLEQEDRVRLPPDVVDAYPLSCMQAGMFFHSQKTGRGETYHNVSTLRIRGRLDQEALQAAVQQVVEAHAILRTSFHFSGFSEPLQLVHRHVDLMVEREDLAGLDPEAQAARVVSRVEEEKRRRFDWTRAPLLVLRVFELGREEFELLYAEYHAILDGWSLHALTTELLRRYARLLGDPAEIAPSPRVAYAELVTLERMAIAGTASRDFYARKLAGVEPILLGPRQAAEAATGEAIRRTVPLSPKAWPEVKRLAQQWGVSAKTLLLASHVRAVSALTGKRDIVTGVVTGTRPEAEDADRALGLFLNTVPLRVLLDDCSWEELVRRIADEEQALLEHRRFPMAEIKRGIGQQRALFDAFFNYTHFHMTDTLRELKDLTVVGRRSIAVDIDFTLAVDFEVNATDDTLELSFLYRRSVFDEEQIERIGRGYVGALMAMVQAPAASIGRALFSDDGGRSSGGKIAGLAKAACIHERIEEMARLRPEAVAIIDGERRVTYRELDRRANGVARVLRARGVGLESLVAICMGRSAELVMAMLGVLKAGGAYVPLDPQHPKERLRLIAEQAGVVAALTDGGGWEELAKEVLVVAAIAQEHEQLPGGAVGPENLAYVIYTSGSTGRPKGVALEHRQAWAFLEWTQEAYDEGDLRMVLAGTSVCFDLSVFEVFAPLWKGTTVVMVQSVLAIGQVAAADEVTLINTVPTALRELVESGSVPRSVRVINVAGEPLGRSLVDLTYERAPWVEKIYNLYGPTEATTYSTRAKMRRGEADVPTIGRPIRGTEVYVLDDWRQPCPTGTAGELYIGGAGVARGYVKQPELTAARFVSWSEGAAAQRLYRTGDRVRLRRDGSLEFLGRLDQQVKVRGFRIEPGEVEAALLDHPAVREAVVAASAGEGELGTTLVAYLVPRDGADLAKSALRAHLGRTLPDYMVPRSYVILDKLPLTANGKVDRANLPAPLRESEVAQRAEPRTVEEKLLLDVWREVLRTPEIGIHDDFFAIGGHSLAAMTICGRARAALNREVPLCALLDAPTVAGLAERLGQ
jgi:amino acid adenylation domain-containing protein/FkbM family methyltransferase